MKTKIYLALLLFTGSVSFAFAENSDSLGLPGDNLDLYAVLDLFKQSKNLNDFEKKINQKDTKVNNLDLNGDGKVDYIRVIDNMKTNAHAIVLSDPINKMESQDIAVIEIEKKGDQSAQLQIIGDKEIYGENYIVEPENKKSNSGKNNEGQFRDDKKQEFVFVNVWVWPSVEYIYYPDYVVWVSPWYWEYWPEWWYPWEPYSWDMYYGWVYPCHSHYYVTYEYRMYDADVVYQPRRQTSQVVVARYADNHKRYEASPRGKAASEKRATPTPANVPADGKNGNQKNQPGSRDVNKQQPQEKAQPTPPATKEKAAPQDKTKTKPAAVPPPPKEKPQPKEHQQQAPAPVPKPQPQPRPQSPRPQPAPSPHPKKPR